MKIHFVMEGKMLATIINKHKIITCKWLSMHSRSSKGDFTKKYNTKELPQKKTAGSQ